MQKPQISPGFRAIIELWRLRVGAPTWNCANIVLFIIKSMLTGDFTKLSLRVFELLNGTDLPFNVKRPFYFFNRDRLHLVLLRFI